MAFNSPERAVGRAMLALAVMVTSACGTEIPDTSAAQHGPLPDAATPTALATTAPTPAPPGTNAATPVSDGWQVIGASVQGRPIRARTVGYGPRKVLFVGGIHGDEPEGVHTTAALPEAFAATGDEDRVTLTIIEDINPDGRASGTRGNANGVDINRNFPASNFDASDPSNGTTPLSQNESRALLETIERVAPNLIIVMHSWSGRQFVNFDGPARDIAERFAQTSGLTAQESTSFAPTPGSLGSFVGRDRGTPMLTVEVLKGSDPVAVWNRLKTALLDAIAGVV